MVECELPKLNMRVRFPLPAPISLESLENQGFYFLFLNIYTFETVSVRCVSLNKKSYRLYNRDGVYYVRFSIPKKYQSILHKENIRYSLGTDNFNTASMMLIVETMAFDAFMERLGDDMKEEKNKLYLSDGDMEVFILKRMEEVYNIYTKSKRGIEHKKIPYEERIRWLNPSITAKQENWQIIERHYASHLLSESRKDNKFEFIANRLLTGELHFASISSKNEDNEEHKQWGDYLYRSLMRIEEHTRKTFEAIQNKEKYIEDDDYINDLIEAVKTKQKNNRISKQTQIEIPWETVWKKLRAEKENKNNPTTRTYLNTKENRLCQMFEFLGYNDLNKITKEDAKRLKEHITITKKSLSSSKFFSPTTINCYIRHYNELIKYAVDEFDLNPHYLLKPLPKSEAKQTETQRDSFDDETLTKVFLREEYLKNRYSLKEFPKFWIPLISLYSGFRVNEIAQLEINDIYKDTKTKHYCFRINVEENDKNKRVKTKNAKRIVPIHSKLIEMGFITFWQQIKKLKNYRYEWCKNEADKEIKTHSRGKTGTYKCEYNENNLFFTLNHTQKGYGGKISSWMNRYLQKHQLNKTDLGKSLVLHGFRHTFISAIVNSKDSKTNKEMTKFKLCKLMGWENKEMLGNYTHIELKELIILVESAKYPKLEKHISLLKPDKEKDKIFDR